MTSELNLIQLHHIRDEQSDGQKDEMTDSNFSVGSAQLGCEPGLTATRLHLSFHPLPLQV